MKRDRELLMLCAPPGVPRAGGHRAPAGGVGCLHQGRRGAWIPPVDRHGAGAWGGWGSITFTTKRPDTIKAVFDTGYEDMAALKRLLHFLASLRDQYVCEDICRCLICR
jgi:hypothetical protein